MFLSSRNDVILIVLTLLLQSTTSQRLQEKIDKLPECSNNCISSAATAAGCAADDFACQCQKSDSVLGIVGSVLGSASSQNKCLVTDCGVVSAASAQLLFRQICGLVKDTTSSSTSAAPTESTPAPPPPIAATPEGTTTPPAPVDDPAPEPTVDFTAPPADATPAEQAPVPTSTPVAPEPVVESTTSAPPTIQSTPIPAFTLPPDTTLHPTTSIPPPPPPPTTSSAVPPSTTSISVTSSSISQSSTPVSSSTTSTSTLISTTTSSARAALIPSSSSATTSTAFIDQSVTRLFPSSTPTGTSYQAEANQSTPTAQKMTTRRMSPAIIAAIVLGVLSFVILCTFIFVLFRRRQQSLKKKRAISTMTAMSRRSGEEITIYLDLGEEGRNYGGVGSKKVDFRESGVAGGKGGARVKSTPLNVPPSLPMVETGRGLDFKFNLRGGLNSHPGKP